MAILCTCHQLLSRSCSLFCDILLECIEEGHWVTRALNFFTPGCLYTGTPRCKEIANPYDSMFPPQSCQYKVVGCHGKNSMTLIRVDDMYKVSPLSWIGTTDISALGPYNIRHRSNSFVHMDLSYSFTYNRGLMIVDRVEEKPGFLQFIKKVTRGNLPRCLPQSTIKHGVHFVIKATVCFRSNWLCLPPCLMQLLTWLHCRTPMIFETMKDYSLWH